MLTLAAGGGDGEVVFGDARDGGGEVGGDLAVLDAVVDVGQNPVLHVVVHLGAAMDQGDARAVTPEVERGDGGGVLAADDGDIQAEEGMGIVVVVLTLGSSSPGMSEYWAGRSSRWRGPVCARGVVMGGRTV